MNDLILRQDQDGVATLTLNRPDRLNALSKEVFEALDEHVESIRRMTKTVGVVVLRGAGGNFSAGYDMNEVLEYVKADAKPHYHSEVIGKLADLPQPVISAVEGHCSTGALELALAADLIVVNESAKICDVYARWGLTPIWGLTLRLPHRIGRAKATITRSSAARTTRPDRSAPKVRPTPGSRSASAVIFPMRRSMPVGRAR